MHCGPSRAGVADGIKGRGGRRGCIHAGQDKTGRIVVVVRGSANQANVYGHAVFRQKVELRLWPLSLRVRCTRI